MHGAERVKTFAIFIGKHVLESLFNSCYPVNIAKFLIRPIMKNICEQLLLNVIFSSNEEQHLLAKIDKMG